MNFSPTSLTLPSHKKLFGSYEMLLVIPCIAESATLPLTLADLELNDKALLQKTLIIIVVNNRQGMPAEKADNLQTLKNLENYSGLLNLAWLDHASDGNEFPEKRGVGLARKLGFDAGIPMLEGVDSILINLDGDSRVDSNYLQEIKNYFENTPQSKAAFCEWMHTDHPS